MIIKAATASDNFQLELLDLQSDVELKEALKVKVFLTLEPSSRKKYSLLIDNALNPKECLGFGFNLLYVRKALFSKRSKSKINIVTD